MKELRGLFRVSAFDESAPDDAVTFELSLPKGGSSPRSRSDLAMWGQYLSRAAASLLVHWNSGRVERAALAHALRWDGRSELARQVDTAFEYYTAWLNEVTELYRWHRPASESSEQRPAVEAFEYMRASLAGLLEELRSRVQFLNARAADIRISGKLEEVANALMQLERDRLAEAVLVAVEAQMREPNRPVKAFEKDLDAIAAKHPEVTQASSGELEALAQAVARKAEDRGVPVREWMLGRGLSILGTAAAQVGFGVAGNATYAWLLRAFGLG